jgi:hypothetical protein
MLKKYLSHNAHQNQNFVNDLLMVGGHTFIRRITHHLKFTIPLVFLACS